MTPKIPAWHKQSNETVDQFNLFDMYLRERNAAEVARQVFGDRGEDGVQAGRAYLQKLKKEKNWEARVNAYDHWIAKNKDDATKRLVQGEITYIKRQRMKFLKRVVRIADKALKVVETKTEDVSLFEADSAAQILGRIDNLWRKFEDSNAALASADEPYQKELDGVQGKLIALIEEKNRKITASHGANEQKEILQ